jgi:linoleoyl-CoA desaturase
MTMKNAVAKRSGPDDAAAMATAAAPRDLPLDSLLAFRRELDELHERTRAKLGAEDIAHIESIFTWSRRFEVAGRGLLHVSLDPLTWSAGVLALWIHKQLETVELAHNILHGTYDHIPGGSKISKRFRSKLPVWVPGWKHVHNVLHHGFTNIVGKDPDARFGSSRLVSQVERRWYHRFQLAEVAFNWLNVMGNLNLHVCGLVDFYMRRAGDDDVLPDRTFATIARMHGRALAAAAPYIAREYVFYPALAGPFAPKVLLGNWLSSVMRNVFTGAAIYSSHFGEEVADYPEGTRAGDRAHWYAMQLATTKNFDVSRATSLLLGALDRQVEHHLFPKLPPNRLREITGDVRALCEKYGMPYRSKPWGPTLRGLVQRVIELGRS